MTKRWAVRGGVAAILASLALLVGGCEPTPGYLERWANRDGSEEMFAGYLLDPEVSHEVHVKALELLVQQWDYSSSMLRGGGTVREMPNPAERDATLRDVLPLIRARYDEGGSLRIEARDALYHLRQATETPEIREAYSAVLLDWLQNHWNPCTEQGAVTINDLMQAVGETAATPIIVANINHSFERMMCQAQQIRRIEWVQGSDAIAQAYMQQWDGGALPDDQQQRFAFVEELSFLGRSQALKNWLFVKVADPELDPLFKNAMLDIIANNRADSDIDGYTRMLQAESVARWTAFEAIVNINGSEGLAHALSNLPAEGEYGTWQGSVREDGFKSAAGVVCGITRLTELGDNARQVFERFVASDNVHARALSIKCLERYGAPSTLTLLRSTRQQLGNTPVEIPRWGGGTLQDQIDQTIAAIEAR